MSTLSTGAETWLVEMARQTGAADPKEMSRFISEELEARGFIRPGKIFSMAVRDQVDALLITESGRAYANCLQKDSAP